MGKNFSNLKSGFVSSLVFGKAGAELVNNKINPNKTKYADLDGIVIPEPIKISDEIVKVKIKISEAGAALGEVSRQPQLSSLFLKISAQRFREAGMLLNKLTTQLQKKKNIFLAPDTSTKYPSQDNAFTPITNMAKQFITLAENMHDAAETQTAIVDKCASGESLKRGFQVIGPQGSTLYDPDDRLIMAMSTSASPLLNQLKNISNQVLAEQPTPNNNLLNLVKARLQLSQSIHRLNMHDTKVKPDDNFKTMSEIAQKGVKP
jgi:hypothetical protein